MTAEEQERSPFSYVEVIEQKRLNETREQGIPWKKWGPYLSERQWGTVREDYSKDGNAWGYFSHDQSRSRAYRWGEDGLAGIPDDKQLCFALALWNGRDPILKERPNHTAESPSPPPCNRFSGNGNAKGGLHVYRERCNWVCRSLCR